jgi:benzoyl-CoA reductase/2-hydroxyglutaryl-CoA dehydratase subunit BcrC/BadD/HgdB
MRIGFTTTIPVEVAIAAGRTPIDLNNLFLLRDPAGRVERAEFEGFPRNTCAWIKGLYSTALEEGIDTVVGVVEGDCSNTQSMMSMLEDRNVEVIPFSYPHQRTTAALDDQIRELETRWGVTRADSEAVRKRLLPLRKKLAKLDELTWRENRVHGRENHLWLVSSSDFNSDVDHYERELDVFLSELGARPALPNGLRLAYIGVPPILDDLYDYVESRNARVVYNEVQRQFAMPFNATDLVDQYLQYTYPYTITERLADIVPQLTLRRIDGVIGYAQAFCHLQIDNVLLKRKLGLPFLALEGDRPGGVDARTALRLDSFLEMLHVSTGR